MAPQASGRKLRKNSDVPSSILFLTPAFLLIICITFVPIVLAFRNSFHATNYAQVGEYQLPLLTLPQSCDSEPLGKYGRMRLAYLKTQRPVLYNRMLLNGTLWPHLQDVQKTACAWLERTMTALL